MRLHHIHRYSLYIYIPIYKFLYIRILRRQSAAAVCAHIRLNVTVMARTFCRSIFLYSFSFPFFSPHTSPCYLLSPSCLLTVTQVKGSIRYRNFRCAALPERSLAAISCHLLFVRVCECMCVGVYVSVFVGVRLLGAAPKQPPKGRSLC